MATKTYHISFPQEWAKEIEKEMKTWHYTPSEYFKKLYRKYKEEKEMSNFEESVRIYEQEKKEGKLKELKGSLADLMK